MNVNEDGETHFDLSRDITNAKKRFSFRKSEETI
jgi:hypothetical protein